jgi:hypothetical protein
MKTNVYRALPYLLVLFSLFTLVLFAPLVSLAQIPETGVGGVVVCSGSHCTFCDLIETGSNLLNWLFGIVFVVFAVLVFISGFKMVAGGVTGNYNSLSDTKRTLTNAIIGIVIIFSAWLIVDTLMKAIANGGELTGIGMWNSISDVTNCGKQLNTNANAPLADEEGDGSVTIRDDSGNVVTVTACEPNSDGTTETCIIFSDQPLTQAGITCNRQLNVYQCSITRPLLTTGTGPNGSYTENEALLALEAAGIAVRSRGDCYDPTRATCTGVAGLQPSTVANLIAIDAGCPTCIIAMTAGTETGHSNACHRNGTCADVACSSSNGDPRACTMSEVIQIHQAAVANGARPIYETISCSLRDQARAQGITAYCRSDSGYGHISGDHFSIYPGN